MKYLPVLILFLACSCTAELSFEIHNVQSNTEELLIASDRLSPDLTWATGTNSSVVRIQDGISTTIPCPHDSLQLRDVHAFSSDHILALSIGPGSASKVLRYKDNEWSIPYTLEYEGGFLDCMDFWDDQHGIVYGDSFDGWPCILQTEDAGETWTRIGTTRLPKAGKGEGGFASSGTCLKTKSPGIAWIGTGAGGNARLLYTKDHGKAWEVIETPMIKGEAAGITSLDFIDSYRGVIVGGDLQITDAHTQNIFLTEDGGESWQAANPPHTLGAFYCVAYEEIQGTEVIVICGPNGADVSQDKGATWANLTTQDLWRCELDADGEGWLMGRDGSLLALQVK
ncbi:MAG: hypothetical protein KTR24_10935 [Saprospiraceae bacterium]|nr:hypothetical protein [Saprospiraceae bacterium]